MRNVKMEVNGKTLTITVNLGDRGQLSASGKSQVIGSTEGNVEVPGTAFKVGLNVYKPAR